MLTRERLLHPATVIAVVALLVALSGAGYAATKIGTGQLKNNAVTTPKIKNNAVTAAKLRTGAVGASDIAAGAVGSAALANGSVTTAKLAAGAVAAGDIANGSIGTDKLANGAVTGLKLANGSVGTAELGPNAVTGAKIAGATILAANIAPGQVVTGKGQLLSGRVELPLATGNTTLLAIPGVATFAVDCTATGANTTVTNAAGKVISATASGVNGGGTAFIQQSSLALGASGLLGNPGAGGLQSATWQLAHGTGTTLHVTTVQVTASGTAPPGPGCAVSAQGVTSD